MSKALVVIDIQNDITKHYRDIIDKINDAIFWAQSQGMYIVYIKHNNLTAGTRTFKPNTKGAELVPELSVVSEHIFVKTKSNALTSEDFTRFITDSKIDEFFICGADATACVKSTSYNMAKSGYIAKAVGVSPFYFQKGFAMLCGFSVAEYIRNRKSVSMTESWSYVFRFA